MRQFTIEKSGVIYPNNAGQQIQADLRVMYGLSPKADNIKGGADIVINGQQYQIKSNRATVCHGCDVENIRSEYVVDGFIYADIKTRIAYIMTVTEFIEFARAFTSQETESTKNGGGFKLRLNRSYTLQREWLARA